ncbi:MAG: IclR family transcriptional regulator [Chloroflexota bacterium]
MVRSVTRTFDILEAIAHHPQGIGVSDIAREIDLHKSTVSRLLLTLESIGVVERQESGSGFQLGDKLYQLISQTDYPKDLIAIARPYLQQLCAQVGEDIGLAVPDGDQVHYIDQVHSKQQAVQVRDWTGTRFPLNTTSTGKLILAFWPKDAVERYLTLPLERFTTATLTSPEAIRQALAIVRSAGCEWSADEFADGFSAVSSPIFDENGRLQAAINIYAPSFRFPNGRQEEITRLILATSRKLTERLGGDWQLGIGEIEIGD